MSTPLTTSAIGSQAAASLPSSTALEPVQAWQPNPPRNAYPTLVTGKVRSSGMCIFLYAITLGIYGLVWYYSVHDEMKRHTGQGVGGGLAILIGLLAGFVSPFLVSAEVGNLYRQNRASTPVSGATGLWCIPGFLLLVGPIIWFVQTNNALNSYWRSLGVR